MGLRTRLEGGRFFRSAMTLGAIGVTAAVTVLAAETVGLVAERYALLVDGREMASFSELQGITTTVTLDPATGARTKYGDIVLKRGMTSGLEMNSWLEAAQAGNMNAARKNASLVMYSTRGSPVARYHLEAAWPSKIEIGALKAGASEVLMETVTLTAEQIQRVAP